MKNILYVPSLGVNLLSAKQICRTGMTGYFEDKNIRIKDKNETMIHAVQQEGLYIVKHISSKLFGKSLDTRCEKQIAC